MDWDVNKIVEQIVEQKGIKKEEVWEKIKEKQEEYGGLLTDVGAAYAIAKDLGVKLEEDFIKIKDLREGLYSVDLKVKVKNILGEREFTKGNVMGRVKKLLVGDETGDAFLVIWNRVFECSPGDILEIRNAYVKKWKGMWEIHVGELGDAAVIGRGKVEGDVLRIKDLQDGMVGVTMVGRVLRVFPPKKFERIDGEGEMFSFILTDGSDTIRVVVWDRSLSLIPNDEIRIVGGHVKERNGRLEVHVGVWGKIEKGVKTNIPKIGEEKWIKDLKDGERVFVKGVLVHLFEPRIIKVCRICGERDCEHEEKDDVMILNGDVDDGTGVLRVVLFGRRAESFLNGDFEKARLELLGKEFIFFGDVRWRDRWEMIVRGVSACEEEN